MTAAVLVHKDLVHKWSARLVVAAMYVLSLTAIAGCGTLGGQALVGTETDRARIAVAKVVPADGSHFARFGHAVAVDGDTVVVGAWGEDDYGEESGAVHVFQRSGSGWRRAAVLSAADAVAGARFGYAVDVDQDTIIVGALYEGTQGQDSGAVYVFDRAGSGWRQSAKLTPEEGVENAHFGKSVSLSGDRLAVGAPGHGSESAHVYRREGDSWVAEASFGSAGARSDARFGSAVALDSEILAVGAWTDVGEELGEVTVYRRLGTSWTEVQRIVAEAPGDRFGYSVAVENGLLAIGAPDGPAAKLHVYRDSGEGWSRVETPMTERPWAQLGHAVALSGGTVLAGDPAFDEAGEHEGRVLLLAAGAEGFAEMSPPMVPDSTPGKSFGISLAANEGVTVIGATGDEERGTAAGAAYIFYVTEGEP
jgi:hypothetical protein